jgi:hypothetical protein
VRACRSEGHPLAEEFEGERAADPWYREYTDNCSRPSALRLLRQANFVTRDIADEQDPRRLVTMSAYGGFSAGAALVGALTGRRGVHPIVDAGLLVSLDSQAAWDVSHLEALYTAIWLDGVVPGLVAGNEARDCVLRVIESARKALHPEASGNAELRFDQGACPECGDKMTLGFQWASHTGDERSGLVRWSWVHRCFACGHMQSA